MSAGRVPGPLSQVTVWFTEPAAQLKVTFPTDTVSGVGRNVSPLPTVIVVKCPPVLPPPPPPPPPPPYGDVELPHAASNHTPARLRPSDTNLDGIETSTPMHDAAGPRNFTYAYYP